MCLLALLKNYCCVLKGNKIYPRLNLRLHLVDKAVAQPLTPRKMSCGFSDIYTLPS